MAVEASCIVAREHDLVPPVRDARLGPHKAGGDAVAKKKKRKGKGY